jgi:hypothetical protein
MSGVWTQIVQGSVHSKMAFAEGIKLRIKEKKV